MKQWKAVLVAVSLLAGACAGGDAAMVTTGPEVVIEQPVTSTTDAVSPTTVVFGEETETVGSELEEAPSGGDVASVGTGAWEECEASGGVWDADRSICTQSDMEETSEEDASEVETGGVEDGDGVSEATVEPGGEPDTTLGAEETTVVPVRRVVYEGIASEDRCLVAGATWDSGQCVAALLDPADAEKVNYWHLTMLEDAYQSVDPRMVPADDRDNNSIGGPWGFYNYHVFYHYNDLEEPLTQYQVMREAASHAVRTVFMHVTDWLRFPHRYDISWTDDPNIVTITGIYPFGEQRTLLLDTDPEQRGVPDIELPLPLPPPIRPTTPFAEPRWPVRANILGRDCPPVEEIWDGYGTEVTDACTLEAIENAVGVMWNSDAEYRQRAVRDGHAMSEFFQEIDNLENPYMKARLGDHSRYNGYTYVQDVDWAGHWPGASMIHLEWTLGYADREFTAEEKAAKTRYYDTLVDRGYDVPDHYLRDDLTLADVFWAWTRALIVRTADGTWRMSYRSVCYWYKAVITIDRDRLVCPDDPNPHFPDSAFFDIDIYPPNHKNYYQDRRHTAGNLPHYEGGRPRMNDQYLGVPPT